MMEWDNATTAFKLFTKKNHYCQLVPSAVVGPLQ